MFLMDQGKTAGIGNYILSEVLYATRINPWAQVNSIDKALWYEIYMAAQDIIARSYASQMTPVERSPRQGSTGEVGHGSERSCMSVVREEDLQMQSDQYHDFRWAVYMQKKDSEGRVVHRDVGPHKRAVHWVPEIQNRPAATANSENSTT